MSFNLFDRTPHAWNKVSAWSRKRNEFERRTAFALLWSLTVHDKHASDKQSVQALVLVERAADDPRNFVKKAVNMALRAVGKRNQALNGQVLDVARRLARSANDTTRWIEWTRLRELSSKSVIRRLAAPATGVRGGRVR